MRFLRRRVSTPPDRLIGTYEGDVGTWTGGANVKVGKPIRPKVCRVTHDFDNGWGGSYMLECILEGPHLLHYDPHAGIWWTTERITRINDDTDTQDSEAKTADLYVGFGDGEWAYVGRTDNANFKFASGGIVGKDTVESPGNGLTEPGTERDALRSSGGGEVHGSC